ncbi:hypothetical protein [Virgisporangium aurantiacum]|uniref:Uncharacterized protein n=1 Tax=Virgisporangium aurantiacum TaxID=175570 RepID=A0A8J3ZB22_9ACTN|nr:hypothetical protein [Virgisporangium aurantiacum]GIJ58485.1 hypothetical protein Vau01_060010 [Virgisporangium aurantiacum]
MNPTRLMSTVDTYTDLMEVACAPAPQSLEPSPTFTPLTPPTPFSVVSVTIVPQTN